MPNNAAGFMSRPVAPERWLPLFDEWRHIGTDGTGGYTLVHIYWLHWLANCEALAGLLHYSEFEKSTS